MVDSSVAPDVCQTWSTKLSDTELDSEQLLMPSWCTSNPSARFLSCCWYLLKTFKEYPEVDWVQCSRPSPWTPALRSSAIWRTPVTSDPDHKRAFPPKPIRHNHSTTHEDNSSSNGWVGGWRDASHWSRNGAKNHHRDSTTCAADNTHANRAQFQGKTEANSLCISECIYPRQLKSERKISLAVSATKTPASPSPAAPNVPRPLSQLIKRSPK